MKLLTTSLVLACAASVAQADSHYSDLFAAGGPTAVIETLGALDDPSPSDNFALGGAQFLGAIEGVMQTRYDNGMSSTDLAALADLPFLRLPVDDNPAPRPFTPEIVTTLFTDILTDLSAARTALDRISDTDTVAVDIRPADLWFDINSNGTRDTGEGFDTVAANLIGISPDQPQDLMIRFDTADAAWLSAYAHMLAGTTELILATDPEATVRDVFDGAATLDALRGGVGPRFGLLRPDDLPEIDSIAAIIVAVEGQWDPVRTRAAHQHFLDGLADNRVFWARLAAETDNTREWIPNSTQVSALPVTFPPGLAESWQAILSDAHDVLIGVQLLPHWRLGPDAGLDLGMMLQDPPLIDIVGLFQGYTLAPYARQGRVIDMQSLRAFDEVTNGNSPMFAIFLN